MCRNIKTLFNFEPPATDDEINASALQFVRKLSGFNKPSQANAEAFDRAVAEVTACARARPRDRGRECQGALAAAVRVKFYGVRDALRENGVGKMPAQMKRCRWPGISISPGSSRARFSLTRFPIPCRASAATGFRRRSLRHQGSVNPRRSST